ncbi:HTH_Tnp_Tc3_2 domain-containing protein [Trichonephila clavipes]|nr:HTH_Tnp_Tc3_2 domain-containing protein [Trichonephila clavipes]
MWYLLNVGSNGSRKRLSTIADGQGVVPRTKIHAMIAQSQKRPRPHQKRRQNRFNAIYHLPNIRLNADDQCIHMWRQPDHSSHPVFVVERHMVIPQGVAGWGEICWNTQSSLIVLQNTLKACSYVGEILTSVVLPMLPCHPDVIYRQDDARP